MSTIQELGAFLVREAAAVVTLPASLAAEPPGQPRE
jgi:hypothetical protein